MLEYKHLFALLLSSLRDQVDRHSRDIRRFVQQAAQEVAPEQLLIDAGAGECQYQQYFSHTKYIAVDFALGDFGWDYSGLDVIGALGCLPIADNVADAVLCTQVLEHVPEPQTIVHELYRILRPGGTLYLTAPQGWGQHQQPHDYFRFTSFALEMLFEEVSFREIEICPMGGFFVYLGNRIAQAPKYLFSAVRPGLWALLWKPLEMISTAMFSGIVPILCNYLDRYDARQDYTLGYACKCRKPPECTSATDE